ncbi:uncharacterized protein [Prorops nasuta]|uniref:uncharacterized protein isoform X2 n=1 Tax=Prorops nasuta TaxID=863751 RepID=UPI0034CF4260
MAEYANNQELSDKSSLLLCEIIVADLITSCNSRLTNSDFSDLTEEIKRIFPHEINEIYYIPPIWLRNSGEKKKSLRSRDDEVKRSLSWLSHNTDINEAKPHWRRTAKVRYKKLLETSGTVQEYLKIYPILLDPKSGHKLIDIDFEELFSSCTIDVYSNWNIFFDNLLRIVEKQKKSDTAKELLRLMNNENISQHAKEFIQILLLSHFLTPRGCVAQKTNIYWKPTIRESQCGIAIHAKLSSDINEIIEKKRTEMYKWQLTVQPFMIGIGPHIEEVTDFYVIVDEIRYRFDSPIKALDICMKIFLTWHTDFPPEAKQVWIFIQRGLYAIETLYDVMQPHIMKLLQKLNYRN